jgi:hypothetical protein
MGTKVQSTSMSVYCLPSMNGYDTMAAKEKRLHYRMQIRVPVYLRGVNENGEGFFELSHTLNVSASGAALVCVNPVKIGAPLQVSIPAPLKAKSAGDFENETGFHAKVTRIEDSEKGPSKKICVHFEKLLYE